MSLFCHIKSDKKVTKTRSDKKSDFSDRVTSGSSTAQISTTHKKNYQYNLLKERELMLEYSVGLVGWSRATRNYPSPSSFSPADRSSGRGRSHRRLEG